MLFLLYSEYSFSNIVLTLLFNLPSSPNSSPPNTVILKEKEGKRSREEEHIIIHREERTFIMQKKGFLFWNSYG
jgi:hypothetical protein